jgi:hypothetical protein
MQPTKEYLDYISKRLEMMNPGLVANPNQPKKGDIEYFDPIDWMGQSAMHYLKNKKEVKVDPDPLFRDLN